MTSLNNFLFLSQFPSLELMDFYSVSGNLSSTNIQRAIKFLNGAQVALVAFPVGTDMTINYGFVGVNMNPNLSGSLVSGAPAVGVYSCWYETAGTE